MCGCTWQNNQHLLSAHTGWEHLQRWGSGGDNGPWSHSLTLLPDVSNHSTSSQNLCIHSRCSSPSLCSGGTSFLSLPQTKKKSDSHVWAPSDQEYSALVKNSFPFTLYLKILPCVIHCTYERPNWTEQQVSDHVSRTQDIDYSETSKALHSQDCQCYKMNLQSCYLAYHTMKMWVRSWLKQMKLITRFFSSFFFVWTD